MSFRLARRHHGPAGRHCGTYHRRLIWHPRQQSTTSPATAQVRWRFVVFCRGAATKCDSAAVLSPVSRPVTCGDAAQRQLAGPQAAATKRPGATSAQLRRFLPAVWRWHGGSAGGRRSPAADSAGSAISRSRMMRLLAHPRHRRRRRRQQRLGVGVQRRGVQRLGLGHLDDAADDTSPPPGRRRASPPTGRGRRTGRSGRAGPAGPASGSGSAPAPTRRAPRPARRPPPARGFSASARAMPMRWRWPPLKACGKRLTVAGGSCTSSINSATRRRRSARSRMPLISSGSPMISPTHMRGLSEAIRVLEDHLHVPAQRPQRGRGRRSRRSVARRTQCCPPSAPAPQDAARRAWSCRSRFRRPAPASRRADAEATAVHRAHLADAAAQQSLADREPLAQSSTSQERRGHGAPPCRKQRRGRCALHRLGGGCARRSAPAHFGQRGRKGQPPAALADAGTRAGDGWAGASAARPARRDRAQQGPRVGMARARERSSATGAGLDHPAGIHDRDVVARFRRSRPGRG